MIRASFLAAIALLIVPAAALGQGYAPPGNSAIDQYSENVPTAGGERPFEPSGGGSGDQGSGGSGAGSGSQGGSPPPPALPQAAEQALSRQGPDGQRAAELAGAGLPDRAAISDARPVAPSADLPDSDRGPLSAIGGALSGSNSGGMGLLFPLLLIATLALAAFAGFRARRSKEADLA